MFSDPRHDSIVNQVSQQLKTAFDGKKKVIFYHGGTNSTRPLDFGDNVVIDISGLNQILHVDTKENFAIVEPNVHMDELVRGTLKYGLVPPVVMEFPSITVGGGIEGGAGESASFKWGLIHSCCDEYEMVLANGTCLTVSPTENQDLYWGTDCSYGSLGMITSAKLKLIPAKKFVELTYYPTHSFDEAAEVTNKKSKEVSVEYLDGIVYSEKLGVIMAGRLSDEQALPVSKFLGAWDEWFYLHAEKIAKKGVEYKELIPLEDYLFRYDRGAFWMGTPALHRIFMPLNRITRFIFDGILKAKPLYRFLHTTGLSQQFLVQDVSIPADTTSQFMKTISDKWHIFPLWLCPLKPGRDDKLSPDTIKSQAVINVGVWGEVNHDFDIFMKINREFESLLKDFGGRKTLYAHSYYTPEEFWAIYDKNWYDALRKKYQAETIFPDIYTATHVTSHLKPRLFRGIISAAFKNPFKPSSK